MGISEQSANEVADSVVRLVKLFSAMRQIAPKVHPAADVSAFPILFNVARGPLRVSAVAECIHSDVSTVSRQVSALVASGLLEKIADPEDRRASILTLTPAGTDVIERLLAQRSQWFQTLLRDWDTAEIDVLRSSLNRFSAAIERSKDELLAFSPPHVAQHSAQHTPQHTPQHTQSVPQEQ